MEQYRTAIIKEILFRLFPPILLFIIAIIAIFILLKFIDAWEIRRTKIITLACAFVVILICGLIIFFDTKDLFSDLQNNNFVEYYGEATFDEKRSSKNFNSFCLNDSEKTIVDSAVGKVDADIKKCIVRVVYGGDSKFVIIFEVERILEERPPVNSH